MHQSNKKPRTTMRLPQLSKANRIARRNGPVSEFILMARSMDEAEKLQAEIRERRRLEYVAHNDRQTALATRAAA